MADALMNRLLDLNDAKGRRGDAPTLGSGYNIGVWHHFAFSGRGSLALRASWASPSLA